MAELTCAVRRYAPTSGWPPVVPPSTAAASGGRPVSPDRAIEVDVLADLLAEVVQLAGDRAIFPGRLAQIAESAMEHDRVRRAVRTLDRVLR